MGHLKAFGTLWAAVGVLVCASLVAQAAPGLIEGVVRNSQGRVLAGVKVTLMDSRGQTVLSAASDSQGRYRLSPVPKGAYTLQVQCARCATLTRGNVIVSDEHLRLNFVLKPNPGSSQPAVIPPGGALGQVSFDQSSELKSGKLKNPSAGGGYSDQASVHSNDMVREYANTRTSPLATTGEAYFESQGRALLKQYNFPYAMKVFRSGLQQYPRSASLYTGLGVSLYSQGQYDAAVAAFCKAARLAPDDPIPYLRLSRALPLSRHTYPEADALLKHFVETHPDNGEAHYAYATRLMESSDPASLALAQSELAKAVSLDYSSARTHLRLGILYDQKQMTARAIDEYRQAIHLNPDLAIARYRLAQDYLRSGQATKGQTQLRVYERLRSIQPEARP